jgi:DNA-binding NtrC family response regulator
MSKISAEKVLIVDDEQALLEVMAERMQTLGIEVYTTTSPLEAIEIVKNVSFDAIIIDLMMPGMDGFKFLKNLKIQSPDLSVILLTAHATIEMTKRAMKLGALDLIEKPADLKLLVEKIKQAKNNKNK